MATIKPKPATRIKPPPILNPIPGSLAPKTFAVKTATTVPNLTLTVKPLNRSTKSPVSINVSRPVIPGKAGTVSVTINGKTFTVKLASTEGTSNDVAKALKKEIEKSSGKKLQVVIGPLPGPGPIMNPPAGINTATITIYQKGFTTPDAPNTGPQPL